MRDARFVTVLAAVLLTGAAAVGAQSTGDPETPGDVPTFARDVAPPLPVFTEKQPGAAEGGVLGRAELGRDVRGLDQVLDR